MNKVQHSFKFYDKYIKLAKSLPREKKSLETKIVELSKVL